MNWIMQKKTKPKQLLPKVSCFFSFISQPSQQQQWIVYRNYIIPSPPQPIKTPWSLFKSKNLHMPLDEATRKYKELSTRNQNALRKELEYLNLIQYEEQHRKYLSKFIIPLNNLPSYYHMLGSQQGAHSPQQLFFQIKGIDPKTKRNLYQQYEQQHDLFWLKLSSRMQRVMERLPILVHTTAADLLIGRDGIENGNKGDMEEEFGKYVEQFDIKLEMSAHKMQIKRKKLERLILQQFQWDFACQTGEGVGRESFQSLIVNE